MMTIDQFVNREIIAMQDPLVNLMFEKEVFQYDDIENLYQVCNECVSCKKNKLNDTVPALGHRHYNECEEEQPQEIFSWYLITPWLADELKAQGEPVLKNEYGTWWGRTTYGQLIASDSVIETIYNKLTK